MKRLLAAVLVALAVAPAASAHTAAVQNGHLVVDGKPFFPIMQWLQCSWRFPAERPLGIDVFLGKGCSDTTDAEELAATAAAGAYSVLPDDSTGTGPSLLGWHYDDEPDLHGTTPAQIAAQRKHVPGKLNFLTVTANFFSRLDPPAPLHGDRSAYRDYARAADVIGFDLYPVYGYCRPDWLPWVGDAQRELVQRYAGGRPTFQWIEAASTSSQWCTGRGVTAAELRAEVWLAVANGAVGIGYFTHSWTPTYSQFRVSAAVQQEMRRTDAQLKALTPQLLGTKLPLRVGASGGRVDAIARRGAGTTVVVAVNPGRTPVAARFSSPGLRGFSATLPGLGVLIRRFA